MIEEMKEKVLEHKTVASVLGTVLVMLVMFLLGLVWKATKLKCKMIYQH